MQSFAHRLLRISGLCELLLLHNVVYRWMLEACGCEALIDVVGFTTRICSGITVKGLEAGYYFHYSGMLISEFV